jgi:hypothetical protein
MGVRIDPARHDILTTGIDLFTLAGFIDSFGDLLYIPVNTQYVGPQRLIRGDYGSPFYQYAHSNLLASVIASDGMIAAIYSWH